MTDYGLRDFVFVGTIATWLPRVPGVSGYSVEHMEQLEIKFLCGTHHYVVTSKMVNPRSRAWVFTCNNYTAEDEMKLQLWDVQYIVYGREIAPTTGTPHLQGYFYSKNQIFLNTLIKKFPGYHFDVARGTPEQNRAYCIKEGDFFEFGVAPVSAAEARKRGGEKTAEKWKNARENAMKGAFNAIDDEIFVKHYSSLKSIERDNLKPPTDLDDVTGYWFYGKAGKDRIQKTGKKC